MAEPVFRTLEILLKAAIAATGTKITFLGEENIPGRGGAVIAMNHTSYVDWLPVSYAAVNRGRRLRFLVTKTKRGDDTDRRRPVTRYDAGERSRWIA